MDIYRIEHPTDLGGAFRSSHAPGPNYWTFSDYDQFVREFEHLPNVPSPEEDARRLPFPEFEKFDRWTARKGTHNIQFGCKDKAQLGLWFTPLLYVLLRKYGFTQAIYRPREPDAAFVLPTQVAFYRLQCNLIERKPL